MKGYFFLCYAVQMQIQSDFFLKKYKLKFLFFNLIFLNQDF